MSSKNSNKINVPEARAAMDKFKMEAAAEVGVNLKQGYNGDLTSRQAGFGGAAAVSPVLHFFRPQPTVHLTIRRCIPLSSPSTESGYMGKSFARCTWVCPQKPA